MRDWKDFTLVLSPITNQHLLQLISAYKVSSSCKKVSHFYYSHVFAAPFPPTDVRAVQDGPTGITVTWTPPSPLGDTSGYRISYSGGSHSGSVTISGSSSSSFALTRLRSGDTYAIIIVGISSVGLPSEPVETHAIGLGMSKKLTWVCSPMVSYLLIIICMSQCYAYPKSNTSKGNIMPVL